jgi:segregation and condensation protein B
MEQSEQMKVLEAMLFASAEPLSPAMIYERLGTDADLNVLLSDVKATYSGRGVELVETGGAWALRTAADVAPYLTIEKDVDRKLSRAALETLAIVAYHQPITRAEIENIRGVATHKGTLDALMEMGWVKPGKRRETPGRPLTWVTTTAFLDHFQLESLMDLPGMDDLKAAGLLDRRPAIETVPDTRDLFDNPDEAAGDMLSGASGGDEDGDEFDGYDETDDEA